MISIYVTWNWILTQREIKNMSMGNWNINSKGNWKYINGDAWNLKKKGYNPIS